MADINQAVKWMEEGKEVLVNGKETFSGTSEEFLKSNFELKENWELNFRCLNCFYNGLDCDCNVNDIQKIYKYDDIKTLKEKIIEDIKTAEHDIINGSKSLYVKEFVDIINKRFGF